MTASAEFLLARAETLLPASGRLALEWSRDLCHVIDHSGHDCAGYHAIRPYLLLFGLAIPPQRQRAFYRDGVRAAALAEGARVLISGAADHTLPATAMWACASAGVTPTVTLVDVCETPLRLSAWFAEQCGIRIETVAADILQYRTAQQRYDLIFVHSFIGLFPPSTWRRLFETWHDLLAPGGRVLMVHRLRRDAPELIRFSAAQAANFRARFLREAELRADETGVDPGQFPDLIDQYIVHCVIYALCSLPDLVSLFEAAGFHVDMVQDDPIDQEGPRLSQGPTLAGGAARVKLVARKR